MNKLYALVNAYRANVDDMTSDQYRRLRPNKGYDLRKKTALKEAIEAFVHSLIRPCEHLHSVHGAKEKDQSGLRRCR